MRGQMFFSGINLPSAGDNLIISRDPAQSLISPAKAPVTYPSDYDQMEFADSTLTLCPIGPYGHV